jgi:osmoprotectant transport system ATP-binding protein
VSKRFGEDLVVDHISLSVKKGETMCIVGKSGCGKTTTLRMINRLIDPTSGTILINNEDVSNQRENHLRRNIGYVIQHFGLFPHYTVSQNISIVPRLLSWTQERIKERIAFLMNLLNLPFAKFSSRLPHELSGGQQQRVAIARALAADPPVLLLDEPFGALDPLTRTEIRKEFQALEELTNKTIVMVTHDISEAFELGDLVCIMDKGSIKQLDTPMNILRHPRDNFIIDFLKNDNFQLILKTLRLNKIYARLPKVVLKSSGIPTIPKDSPIGLAIETFVSSKFSYLYVTDGLRDFRRLDRAKAMNWISTFPDDPEILEK